MIEKVYITGVTFIIILAIFNITKEQLYRRKIKDKEILKVDRSFSDLILALNWLVIFIVWLSVLIIKAKEVYDLLYGNYISNVFQLLDTKFLESSLNNIYDEFGLIDYLTISRYQDKLITIKIWIILSLCNFIVHLYRGWQRNIIYKDGIFINGIHLKWDKIVNYKWVHGRQRNVFKEDHCYKLVLKLKKSKFLDIENETSLKIKQCDKELVEDVLKEYVIKEYTN